MSARVTRQRLAALTPAEAAALWLVQRDAGTPVETGLFDEWYDASPAHRDAWQEATRSWSLFDAADDPFLADLRAAALASPPAGRWHATRRYWQPIAVAASVIVVALFALHLLPGARDRVPAPPAFQTQIVAAADRPRSVRLPDGSRVTLDAGSRLDIAFAGNERALRLDHGQAGFDVAHDAERPFVVRAGDQQVTALGTRFDVAIAPTGTRVTLFQGKVRVDGRGHAPLLMTPGQQLLASADAPVRVLAISAEKAALWRAGLVDFDNVTLAEAAETLNQGSVVQLRIPDPAVARLHVSGRFRLRESERFARTVAELLPVKLVRAGRNRIELRAR
jgi:transmembrane sensor